MTLRIIALFLFLSFSGFSQYKNSIKTNLAAAATQIYTLQYERTLNSNWSINATLFYRPKNDILFGDLIDDIAKEHGVGVTGIKFEYIFMDEAKIGVKGVSPELRYYIGKKKNRAFIGLFGMYEDFDMQVPAEFEIPKDGYNVIAKIPVNFTFQSLSGGVLIGTQFKWDRVGLDIVFAGPHFGQARDFYAAGTNSNLENLTESEKEQLRSNVKERFGLTDKYFEFTIGEGSAEIKSVKNIPYFGIRGFGFNLSYNF